MNFAEARKVVEAHPKRIGSFVRTKLPAGTIRRSTVINFVRYDFDSFTGKTWRYGYSIGDGRVYGHKAVRAEGIGMIDQPDLDVVCAEGYYEPFDISEQPRAAHTTPSALTYKVDLG